MERGEAPCAGGDLGFGGGGAERIAPPALTGGGAAGLAGVLAAGRDSPPDDASAGALFGFGGGGAARTAWAGTAAAEAASPDCAGASADVFPRTVTVTWPMVRQSPTSTAWEISVA